MSRRAEVRGIHCCGAMASHLDAGAVAIVFEDRFRQYGIGYHQDSGRGIQLITFCPWCGRKLPKDLVDEWFHVLGDELGIAPDDPSMPNEMQSSVWWRRRGL